MTGVSRRLARAPVLSVAQAEGAGATVRRSIGGAACRNFTPFLLLDDFTVGKGAGFPDHPHRGMTTVTYMLEGYVQHEDSKGHKGTIGPGELQFMQAGKGILHAEMPLHEEGMPDPHGLQLWIDLKKDKKMMDPTYQELSAEAIPTARYSDFIDIKVIIGAAQGSAEQGLVKSPIHPVQGVEYYDIRISKAGESVFQPIPKGWSSFLYTLTGDIFVGPSGSMVTPLKPYHTVILTSKEGQDGVLIESATDNVRFVLIAGEPLDQEIVQHGPFVLTSQEEVRQAFMDYQMGRNGFEGAHEWASQIGGRQIKA
ncbi:RNA pol II transcription cofactor [Cystobasidiomycetes sp. EMM_F5]